MATRRIDKILKSRPTIEGAGVHLKRALAIHRFLSSIRF